MTTNNLLNPHYSKFICYQKEELDKKIAKGDILLNTNTKHRWIVYDQYDDGTTELRSISNESKVKEQICQFTEEYPPILNLEFCPDYQEERKIKLINLCKELLIRPYETDRLIYLIETPEVEGEDYSNAIANGTCLLLEVEIMPFHPYWQDKPNAILISTTPDLYENIQEWCDWEKQQNLDLTPENPNGFYGFCKFQGW